MKVKIVKNTVQGSFELFDYYNLFVGKEVKVVEQSEGGYVLDIPTYNGEPTSFWFDSEVELMEG